MLKASLSRSAVVAFDGTSDTMALPSSDSTLAFLHTSAVFDIFVCARAKRNKYGVLCANSFNPPDKGITIDRDPNTHELTLFIWMAGVFKSLPTSSYFPDSSAKFLPGIANKLLFRSQGTGTVLSASANFVNFYGGVGALPALPVGNATAPMTIGSYAAGNFLDFDLHDLLIYNRNLSSGELVTMGTYFSERYGV